MMGDNRWQGMITPIRRLRSSPARQLAHTVVVIVWTIGWAITWPAARASFYIEPTDQALKAAHDSVAQGIFGSCLLLIAAVVRLTYRPPLRVVLTAIIPAWVLVTFLAGPHDYGAGFWTLTLVPVSFATLAWGVITDRRVRSATLPAELTGPR